MKETKDPTLVFKKTVLANGIRVVSETHPRSKAMALGLWVMLGTRDEPQELIGISHFLEHLVFKGTRRKSAYQIAKTLEEVGGELNAYTTRESTCYHSLVLRDYWKRALGVLAELISEMALTRENFILEKSVVLQEISSSTDSHEELIFDRYLSKVYHGHPLGRPILGDEKTIGSLTKTQVEDYYRNQYTGDQLILSVAGDIDHDVLVAEAEKMFGKIAKKRKSIGVKRTRPKPKAFIDLIEKQSDQAHLVLGLPSTSFTDRLRFEAFIVNTLLGGGMTSRLFQKIREKKGLAYSIYSSLHTFTDSGLILIYSSSEPKQIKSIAVSIIAELRRLKKTGFGRPDLKLFKTQVTGSILLGSDDLENRMSSLGINEMVLGRYKSVDQIIEEINDVSMDSLHEYLEKHFDLSKLGGVLLSENSKQHKSWLSELF